MINLGKKLFTDILSVFFPETCPGCKDYLSEKENKICWKCFSELPFFDPVINHPVHQDILGGRIPVRQLACLIRFSKENAIRNIMHSIKYEGRKDLAFWFGIKTGEKLLKEEFRCDVLIPVPLHPEKLKQRGYNQAECIARGIAHVTGWKICTDVLLKSRNTKSQTKMNREQRMQNLKNSFILSEKYNLLSGKEIAVVDDVLTTGATTEHVWMALKEIPGVKFSAIYLCHARD